MELVVVTVAIAITIAVAVAVAVVIVDVISKLTLMVRRHGPRCAPRNCPSS